MSDLSSDTPYGEENPRGALPPRKPRKDPRDARAARSAAQTTAKQAEQDARKKATLLQPATEESLLETVESEDFIKFIDTDGDGLINYQELVKILSN